MRMCLWYFFFSLSLSWEFLSPHNKKKKKEIKLLSVSLARTQKKVRTRSASMNTGPTTAEVSASSSSATPLASPAPTRVYFTCRRCRTKLFTAEELVPHNPQDGTNKNFKYRRSGPQVGREAANDPSSASAAAACTSYFLDPDQSPWVAEDIREANASGAVVEPDTIYCPNFRCRAKLGTQSWTGSQCSCGAWITPAFRIHARAVDKMSEYESLS